MLLSLELTQLEEQNGRTYDEHLDELVFQILDATRAHFHSPAQRQMWVDLCDEDSSPGMCGHLLKSMYGNRDAASNWEDFSRDVCVKVGFVAGVGSPCLMYHPERNVRLFKHGDDFILSGRLEDVDFVTKVDETHRTQR